MAEWTDTYVEMAGDPSGLGEVYRKIVQNTVHSGVPGDGLDTAAMAGLFGHGAEEVNSGGFYRDFKYEDGILSFVSINNYAFFDETKAICDHLGSQLRVRSTTRFGNGGDFTSEVTERVVNPGDRSIYSFIEPEWEKLRTEKPFSREGRYDLGLIAQDLATEYTVGGDRFTVRDIQEILEGIRREDLDLLSELAKRDARMIQPDVPADYLDSINSAFLQGVRCAGEQDGADGKKVRLNESFGFRMNCLEYDKDRWFRLADGTVAQCSKISRRAMWRDRLDVLKPVQVHESYALGVAIRRIAESYGRQSAQKHADGDMCCRYDFARGINIPEGFVQAVDTRNGGTVEMVTPEGAIRECSPFDFPAESANIILAELHDVSLGLAENRAEGFRPEQDVLMDFIVADPIRIVDEATGARSMISKGVIFTDRSDNLLVGGSDGHGGFVYSRLDRLDDSSLKTMVKATSSSLNVIISQMASSEVSAYVQKSEAVRQREVGRRRNNISF